MSRKALGKPVQTLLNTTERPEAVHLGASALVGVDPETMEREVDRLCLEPEHFQRMSQRVSPSGNGNAAQLIAARLWRDLQVERNFGLPAQTPPTMIDLTACSSRSLTSKRRNPG